MEAGDRRIAFEYDDRNRIVRARASTGQAVAYEYDSGGRLSRVAAADGRVHRYTYTDRYEMATIVDPGRTIENTYDANGRCVRQIVRYPDEPEALTFTFSYRLDRR
jgi:YD repeat-containing protein